VECRGHIDPCYVRDPGPGTPLTRSALPVLQNLLGEGLEDWPASVILTDAGGVVLCRLTADHDLAQESRSYGQGQRRRGQRSST
jgi:hypothetical protein